MRNLNRLGILHRHKSGWADHIGLGHTAVNHRAIVVAIAEDGPEQFKLAHTLGPDLAGCERVAKLLENGIGKHRTDRRIDAVLILLGIVEDFLIGEAAAVIKLGFVVIGLLRFGLVIGAFLNP